jgi:hypothetical protein
VTRRSLTGLLALALAAGAAGASVAPASTRGAALREGRRPAPATDRPIFFHGTFANPRWGGSIDLVVSQDGRTVSSVAGIAPGACNDEDFGHLVAGQDGATGPTFEVYLPARIAANGSFSVGERHAGQRRPFKAAHSATVSGTFDGDRVRGTLRASRATTFDSCTASASFTARRVR